MFMKKDCPVYLTYNTTYFIELNNFNVRTFYFTELNNFNVRTFYFIELNNFNVRTFLLRSIMLMYVHFY